MASGEHLALADKHEKSDLAAHRPRGLPYISATIPKRW